MYKFVTIQRPIQTDTHKNDINVGPNVYEKFSMSLATNACGK